LAPQQTENVFLVKKTSFYSPFCCHFFFQWDSDKNWA